MTKELNTGEPVHVAATNISNKRVEKIAENVHEPVALVCVVNETKFYDTQHMVELHDGIWELYHQDYVNQLLGEIKALKIGDIQWSHAFDLAKIEIAELKAEIETLKANFNKENPVKEPDFTVEKDNQDWKFMDGATAFWLIQRHSNHWGDARLMMEEWLEANSHPVKELHLSLQKTEDGELVAVTYTDDEHRIVEVLWERPPVKEQLTDEEWLITYQTWALTSNDPLVLKKAILRKAQEK